MTMKLPSVKQVAQEIWTDLKKTELIPIKVLFFFINAAYYSVIPFFTVHLGSLGVPMDQVGIVFFIQPFITLPLIPLIGLIVDKVGRIKLMLIIQLLLAVTLTNMLPLVPAVPQADPSIKHRNNSSVALWCDHATGIQVSLETPSSGCTLRADAIESMSSAAVTCHSTCPSYNGTYICLATRKKNVKCLEFDTVVEFDLYNGKFSSLDSSFQSAAYTTNMNLDSSSPTLSFDTLVYNGTELTTLECDTNFDQRKPRACSVTCSNTPSMLTGNGNENSSSNGPIGNVSSLFTCTNKDEEDKIARGRITTLLSYFILMTLATMFMATSSMTFDAIVLKMMKEQNADYGLQKIWGIVGASIFSPVSGMLMGVFGDNYVIGFYIYGALKLFCVVFILFFPLTATLPSENIWKGIKSVVKNGESTIFMLNMFLMGSIWGFLEGYLFFFMEEIGSPKYVMGLTNTVAGVSCLPIIFLSGHILDKIGHAPVLIITFFVYAIRLLAYSFVWNPYLCLVIEISEALTSNLMAVASVTYAGLLAPPTLRASIQGLLTAVHYGIGRGCGQFVGGQLMANFGSRITFRVMSGICVAGGTLYFIEYHGLRLWRRRHQADINNDSSRPVESYRNTGSLHLRNDGKVNRAFVFDRQNSANKNSKIIPI